MSGQPPAVRRDLSRRCPGHRNRRPPGSLSVSFGAGRIGCCSPRGSTIRVSRRRFGPYTSTLDPSGAFNSQRSGSDSRPGDPTDLGRTQRSPQDDRCACPPMRVCESSSSNRSQNSDHSGSVRRRVISRFCDLGLSRNLRRQPKLATDRRPRIKQYRGAVSDDAWADPALCPGKAALAVPVTTLS